ncbi:hypothetical protein BaRGS_00019087 [Batillaria attramentaria]|uniref:Uncharacterized protein n=1 Tax=Batillaria attramentaria TaxID=370345 RepID=A0ABD0KQZ4_9CAEN
MRHTVNVPPDNTSDLLARVVAEDREVMAIDADSKQCHITVNTRAVLRPRLERRAVTVRCVFVFVHQLAVRDKADRAASAVT